MTKSEAWDAYYTKTRQLERRGATVEDYKAAFPSRESLLGFWVGVKNLCWPESYGQSPWDCAACVAYRVANGIRRDDAEDVIVAAYLQS